MKKINLMIIPIAFAMLLSCKNDDDTDTEVQEFSELIVGEWNYSNQIIDGMNEEYSDPCHQEFEVLSFENDNTYTQTEFENVNGNGCEEVDPSSGTWEINEQELTLNGQIVEIITLNETELSFTYNNDDDEVIIDNLTRKK